MKNIHVLPTDKPSRLFYNVGGALLFTNYENYNGVNIYITSNDKFIKDEYITDGIEVIKATPKLVDAQGLVNRRDWKKIILTTDQDLIKDGVWGIEDGFLEWFVKNPTCEYVELKGYAIVLPGESCDCDKICDECKAKQETSEEYSAQDFLNKLECNKSKQETLEEVAKRLLPSRNGFTNRDRLNFIEGATYKQIEIHAIKLQQQQMYSEEEVEDLIYKVCGTVARLQGITLNGNHIDTAYKQFKKK